MQKIMRGGWQSTSLPAMLSPPGQRIFRKVCVRQSAQGKGNTNGSIFALDKMSAAADPLTAELLGKLKSLSGGAAKAALSFLPQEMKEELAVAGLNHYSDEIARMMAGFAEQKGIELQVRGVEVVRE